MPSTFRSRFPQLFGFALIACALLASCSSPDDVTVPGAKKVKSATASPLVASIAASTAEPLEQLAAEFRQQHAVEVTLNAGPTNGLATQILAGAPADIFISASRDWSDKLAAADLAADQVDLLGNRLVAVVPRGNPAAVHTPQDLAAPAVKRLALAGETVPAGVYAEQALTKLGMLESLSGKLARGHDVRAALGFVERGEAEAAIVYATDALMARDVEVAFEFDPSLHDKIVYVLVLINRDGLHPEAREFYDFLKSDAASNVFADAGFIPLNKGD